MAIRELRICANVSKVGRRRLTVVTFSSLPGRKSVSHSFANRSESICGRVQLQYAPSHADEDAAWLMLPTMTGWIEQWY
jgi:hypothetical protein